jgi:segregation and condensation protein B
MNDAYVRNVIEAALLAAGGSLPVAELLRLFDDSVRPSAQAVRTALAELAAQYEGRGIELRETASGFRIQVRRELAAEISRLWPERAARYSRALLETLALIAYRQPITRAEIEAVRGVAVNPNIIRTMLERNWVRVVGHRAVPGHPELLGTTREFLDYFGLKSLDELPPLGELTAMGDVTLELALAAESGAAHEPAAAGGDAAETMGAAEGESADSGDAEESGDDEEFSAEGGGSAELVAAPHELDG